MRVGRALAHKWRGYQQLNFIRLIIHIIRQSTGGPAELRGDPVDCYVFRLMKSQNFSPGQQENVCQL